MKFQLAVKGIVARKDGKILIVKRGDDDLFAPGIWETMGGEVEKEEDPRVALEREIKERAGLSVRIREPFNAFTLKNNKEKFKIGITFLCDYLDGEVKLGKEHSEYKWIDPKSIKQYETIPAVLEEIIKYANKHDVSYGKFAVSQKAVLIRDGKCLIAEINKRPGIWDLPGGRIDRDENAEDSFCREMKEELGINKFQILGVCGQITWVALSGVDVYGVVSLISTEQEIVLSPEHVQEKWIAEDEISECKFIWPQMDKIIKRAFEMEKDFSKKW